MSGVVRCFESAVPAIFPSYAHTFFCIYYNLNSYKIQNLQYDGFKNTGVSLIKVVLNGSFFFNEKVFQ